MDELEALEILKRKNLTVTESAEEKKKRAFLSDIRIYLISAACGFLLLTIFYTALHPVDRLKLCFALSDNYAITTKVQKNYSQIVGYDEVLVDGNILYSDGNYYEISEDQSYVYKQIKGMWYRYPYYQNDDSIDVSRIEDLLDKNNYERPILPWAPVTYTKPFSDDMKYVNMKMHMGRFIISGEIVKANGPFHEFFPTTIEIHNFGLVNLELPEEYIIVQ